MKRTSLDTQADVAPPSPAFNGPSINNHSATSDSAIDKGARAIRGQPTKALDDAMFAAAQLLHDRPRNRRRVILLISDGVNGGRKFNKVTTEDVIKALLAENISVYSIAVPTAFLERKISPVDRERSPLIRYANHSGGEIYYATNEHSFEEFYSRLTEQARNQYTLAYIPRGTDPKRGLSLDRGAREAGRAGYQDAGWVLLGAGALGAVAVREEFTTEDAESTEFRREED